MTTKTHKTENTHVSRYVMAVVFGLIAPAVASAMNFEAAAIVLTAAVFILYSTKRKDSEASHFGIAITIIAMVLLVGRLEMNDQIAESHPHTVVPSYVLQ